MICVVLDERPDELAQVVRLLLTGLQEATPHVWPLSLFLRLFTSLPSMVAHKSNRTVKARGFVCPFVDFYHVAAGGVCREGEEAGEIGRSVTCELACEK
jgi:hypothetical protein